MLHAGYTLRTFDIGTHLHAVVLLAFPNVHNVETFQPNNTANLGNGREKKNNKKLLSGAVQTVQLARGRNSIAAFLRWPGYQIHIGSYTPYPAQMIDCLLAEPNGSPSLISLLSAHMWGDTDGRRASSCTDAQ